LEDWTYLVSSKLQGRPLSEAWKELGPTDQEAVAAGLGQLLAKLHGLPLQGFRPGGIQWDDFLIQAAAAWAGRPSVARLPPRLRDSGLGYIARARLGHADTSPVFLHGDLAPENCLVSNAGGSWRVSGLFDFGNAMAGHAPFDFTALTALLAPGNARIIHQVFGGYGSGSHSVAELRPLLMAYTLLHPMGDPYELLRLLPGLDRSSSWEEVAERFWPAEK
jgi:hygromycin-B 7''-O-kinase